MKMSMMISGTSYNVPEDLRRRDHDAPIPSVILIADDGTAVASHPHTKDTQHESLAALIAHYAIPIATDDLLKWRGCPTVLEVDVSDRLAAICAVIVEHRLVIDTDATVRSIAIHWLARGFTASEVDAWLDAGVLNFNTARELRTLGATPDEMRTEHEINGESAPLGYWISMGKIKDRVALALVRLTDAQIDALDTLEESVRSWARVGDADARVICAFAIAGEVTQ